MTKKKKLIIIGAAIVILIIIIGVNLKGGSRVEVEVKRVEKGKIESQVSAPGEIHAIKQVNINSDIMGKLVKLYVEEGDWVKNGQVLAKLDSTEQFAAYERAISNMGANRADLEFKEQQYQRKKELYKKGLISKENFENILTAVEVARLNLDNARTELRRTKKRLDKTTIRSPISGTVMSISVEEGENVITGTMNNPGTVLLTISNLDAMEMIADVNESEIPLVFFGDTAKVSIEAFPDTEFIGTVYKIASMPKSGLTSQSGVVEFEVKINLPHHPGMLPGMSASADIITDVKEEVLRVPLQAIVTQKKEKGVFTIKEKRVEFVPITTGITQGRWAEVEEGLEEGVLVATGPLKILMKLVDKQEVSWEIKEDSTAKEETEEVDKESSDKNKPGGRGRRHPGRVRK
ncbi:efflux RND transporter periplasmic adaptor subunit [candidate division WOR-3 bacterium]|nr:efflux RND transporter periplasmic adaptor subunit [candidate division WOR-3 bacterium]